MYLVAIAWLYVALLVAIADDTVVGGVLTFLFGGLGPLALFLWIFGSPVRRRRHAEAALAANDSEEAKHRQ